MRKLWGLLLLGLLAGAKGGGQLALLGDVQRVLGVAVSADSLYTLTARDVQVWNAETGILREVFKGPPPEDWKAMALSPNQQSLAVAVIDRTGPGKTQIRLLPSGRRFEVEDLVEALAFNSEGGLLACASSGRGSVWVMEVGPGRVRWRLGDESGRVNSVSAVAFSPDGKLLAAGGASALYVWNLDTGNLRLKLPGAVKGVVFAPDSQRLYATLNGLSAFDVAGNPLWNLKGEGGALALSPDGSRLAWAGSAVRLVDAASGTAGPPISAPILTKATARVSSTCVAFTPDGRRVITGGDGGGRLWATAGRWLGGLAVWPEAGPPWASYAADGSFECDPTAEQYLRYETGGRLRLLKDFPGLHSPESLHKGWRP